MTRARRSRAPQVPDATRAAIGVPARRVALAALVAAGTLGGTAEDALLGSGTSSARHRWRARSSPGSSSLLLGIIPVTNEWRHGTITRTLLVDPASVARLVVDEARDRERRLGAVLAARGARPRPRRSRCPGSSSRARRSRSSRDIAAVAARIVLAIVLVGALGVGVGAVVQSQIGGARRRARLDLRRRGPVGALLGLVDLGRASPTTCPAARCRRSIGTEDDGLPFAGVGGAVSLAWVVALGRPRLLRTSRQDVT